MKKHIVFACLTTILLFIVIYFLFLSGSKSSQSYQIPVTKVQTEAAQLHNIPVKVKATGLLVAPNSVTLKSQLSGIINKINFHSGDYVKKGQLLMSLDSTQQQADVDSALADYTKAKAQYDRTSTLFKENQAVSKSELDDAKAQYMQAKANYDAALYKLSNTQIIAPFSGYLTMTDLALGSYVSNGDTLVGLVDKENLKLQYAVGESYAKSIKVGQVVDFTTDAYPGETFQAKVNYISPDVSQENLTFTVRAQYDNKQNVLSPGMSVYVSQVIKAKNMVLAVPESALSAQSGGFVVYTILDNKAKLVPITIGQIHKGYVSVLSGLKEGGEVITSTDGSLADGLKVEVSKS